MSTAQNSFLIDEQFNLLSSLMNETPFSDKNAVTGDFIHLFLSNCCFLFLGYSKNYLKKSHESKYEAKKCLRKKSMYTLSYLCHLSHLNR